MSTVSLSCLETLSHSWSPGSLTLTILPSSLLLFSLTIGKIGKLELDSLQLLLILCTFTGYRSLEKSSSAAQRNLCDER